MQACKSVLMVLCAATAVSATGCADRSTGASDEERLIEAVEANGGIYVGEIPQASLPPKGSISQARQDGLCCWGHCNSSNAFENIFLTSGCREWVVDSCHNAGLAFNPNGDAWWGTC